MIKNRVEDCLKIADTDMSNLVDDFQ